KGIASAFGKIGKNSKNSKEPIKGVSGALGEIAKHKEAIKTVGKLFVAYFAASKVASGVNAVVKGITALSPAFGALKTATTFLMANPFVLAIAGITALVVGFVLLYKHNKKFRDFCNGIAKSVKDGIGGGIKWLKDKFDSMSKGWKNFKKSISDGTDNVVKSIKNGAKKVGNFFVGVGKTIKNVLTTIGKILIFANPVVLGFALMYKESAKFRKFVKGIVGFVGDLKDGISKKTKEIKKDWDKHWDKTKEKASKTWDGIKDNAKESTEKLAKTIREKHDEIHDKWSKTWKKSKNYLSDKWDEINDESKKKFGKDFKGLLFDNLDKIGNKFQEIWNAIRNGFSDMWNGLKQLAGDGINAVIKIPNDGIDGINGLIHDFGGPKNAIGKIPKVKFANGTGFFNGYRNAITRPTLATLNDGNDSPETGNQEMVILPNGKAVLPQGRNAQMLLPA
ncbi:transglycosylase, partial [Streptococcus macedonicus]|nr:transglycosylase [Streptococcus macedonicus]